MDRPIISRRKAILDESRPPGTLPAQLDCSAGTPRIDYRAIFAITVPLMANSTVQILLSLIDMWFIGHISARALAAVGAAQGLTLCVLTLLGGVGAPVQATVAKFFGGRRYTQAGVAVWTALWSVLCITPVVVGVALSGPSILKTFGLPSGIANLASDFWLPRVIGSPFGFATAAVLYFFYGIGRPSVTVAIACMQVFANAVFNEIFIFKLGWGIAGCGWASTLAQAIGLLLALTQFLDTHCRRTYRTHLTWKPRVRNIFMHFRLAIPMGILSATDLVASSLFQLMQVRLGAVSGAATQVVMVLETVAYVPAFGIASAGTTLVGQSIGACDLDKAKYIGTRIIFLTVLLTGAAGLAIALAGSLVLPLFVPQNSAEADRVVILAGRLLWVAAAYDFFEGLNLGSIMCLRGAGDAKVPAVLAMLICVMLFLPLAHSLTFPAGDGWINFLPQFGWGTVGGWIAVVIYVMLVGSALFLRWRSVCSAAVKAKALPSR